MPKNDAGASTPLTERILANYKQLRNAERKVADYLIQNPNQLLRSTITEFSRELGVSEATISRFSKAVGYDGFPSLKLSIAADTTVSRPLPNLPNNISEDDTLGDMREKLLATLTTALKMTGNTVDMDAVEAAAEAISEAKRLIFIGVGGAASICVEAMHLFVKSGRPAETYFDGYTQITAASTLREGDTLVGISHTGQTRSVAHALSIAAKGGASTIAITSDKKSGVARAASLVLATWNSQPAQVPLYADFLEGRMAQLFLVDLIYLNTLFKSKNGEKDNLLVTGEALKRYYDTK